LLVEYPRLVFPSAGILQFSHPVIFPVPVVQLILLGIPLLSLVWWIWADRRLSRLGISAIWRIGFSLAVLALLTGFVWIVLGRKEIVSITVPAAMYALVLLWGLIFLPFVAIPTVLGWSITSLVSRLFRKLTKVDPEPVQIEKKWSRREWLAAAAVSLPVVATYGTAIFNLPRMTRFRIKELSVALKDLPVELDGVRIAHVTDTHVGKFTCGKVVDEIVAATNRLEADLVVFTGDLIDNSIRDLPEAVSMLQRMRAKSGVFVVEGNHDLFDDPAGFVQGVRDGGLVLLRNQVASMKIRGMPVQILGTVWNRSEEDMAKDVAAVASLRDPAAFPILLAHHPHVFDHVAEHGIPLTLAGHTHGGQLMLNRDIGAGPAMFRYWSGLYQKAGRALVVGNGTGNWFPVRMNAPAEIIHVTLRRA
jgi:predicted MPP superfamily phosphohydrolase